MRGSDYVTLLTCTPYMVNSHRLFGTGKRIPYVEENETAAAKKANQQKVGLMLVVSTTFLLLLLVISNRIQAKKTSSFDRSPVMRSKDAFVFLKIQ